MTPFTEPPRIVEVARAPEPKGMRVTVGGVVELKPEPLSVMRMLVTAPPDMFATPVAPEPTGLRITSVVDGL